MRKTKQSRNDLGRHDVLIAGAGFAGLALAIALRQGLGETFSVAVADPALAKKSRDDARASAIAAAARRLFETIGVWEAVADGAQPILDMAVTDSRLNDAVRPTFLTFDGEVEPGEPFAHMVENGPLQSALVAKAKQAGVALHANAVSKFEYVGTNTQASARSFDPHPDPSPSRGREQNDGPHGRPSP